MIASHDPRWKVAANYGAVLSPPLDLTPKGAKAWVVEIRNAFLGLPAGGPERKEFLEQMDKQFWYVGYLYKGRKALLAFLKAEGDKLKAMLDTEG